MVQFFGPESQHVDFKPSRRDAFERFGFGQEHFNDEQTYSTSCDHSRSRHRSALTSLDLGEALSQAEMLCEFVGLSAGRNI